VDLQPQCVRRPGLDLVEGCELACESAGRREEGERDECRDCGDPCCHEFLPWLMERNESYGNAPVANCPAVGISIDPFPDGHHSGGSRRATWKPIPVAGRRNGWASVGIDGA